MASRKKLLTSAVALGTAAALALGGTFAWQSINQTALNESSDDVNPGGRLHDDFDGTNKDVYVENFAEENIFARIRLTEYFEVVMNYGGEAQTVDTVIGERDGEETDDTGTHYERNGTVFKFDGRVNEDDGTVNAGKDPAVTDSDYYWWTWTMGGEDSDTGYYMPTFNLNKDSLEADVNGKYKTPGVITSQNIGQYTDYHAYKKNETRAGTEIFDADRNQVDEVGSDFSAENLAKYVTAGNITLYNKLDAGGEATYAEDGMGITHTAKEIGTTKGLISMEKWLELLGDGRYDADTHGGYWVYDTDGWVYWSSPIAPASTTGRLLDGIQMNHVMDDSWYYKLTVEGQFVTADDVGKLNDTGFYQDADEAPSTDAETLLEAIGVDMGGEGNTDDENGQMLLFSLTQRDAEDDYSYSYYNNSVTEGFLYDLDYHNDNVFDVEPGDGVTLSMSFENTKGGTSYEDGVLTLAHGDVSIITVTATYNGTDYTFKLTPVYSEIVITKGNGAETRYYRIPGGAYKLTAQNFDGDVTYTVSADAMRSTISEIDGAEHLSMSGYESAESYTVTATDGSGNTGTVTIFPMDTWGFDGAIFWLYKNYGGEYGFRGIGQLIDTQTYYWDAGDEYRVSLDLPVSTNANFSWTLTDDATGNATTDDRIGFSENGNILTIKCGDSLTAEDSFTLKGTSDMELPTDNEGGKTTEYTFHLNFGERPEAGDEDDDEDDNPAHTLTATDPMGGGTFDLAMILGKMIFKAELDGTKLESGDNLTATIYKTGETEVPFATWSGDEIAWDAGNKCLIVNLLEKNTSLSIGSNVFDLYLSYQTEDGTVRSEKISLTISYAPVVLNRDGTATGTAEKHSYALLALDGVSAPLSGYSSNSSFIDNIKVVLTGDEEVTFSKENESPWVTDGQADEVYSGTSATVMFDYRNNAILFWPEAACTVEITLGGETYSATFTED